MHTVTITLPPFTLTMDGHYFGEVGNWGMGIACSMLPKTSLLANPDTSMANWHTVTIELAGAFEYQALGFKTKGG